MSAEANGILRGLRWVERGSIGPGDVEDLLRGGLTDPGGRSFGTSVTDHRSSWVRFANWAGEDCYFKTYDYPTWADRWRGALRTTALAPSRAKREWDALSWLEAHGFAVAQPLGLVEARRGPFLRRAVLITRAYGGQDLRWWLGPAGAASPGEILEALATFVSALHRSGFHDRNLDPRNILARRSDQGDLVLTKIDSPRFVLASPGTRRAQRLAEADRTRLGRGLEALGFDLPGALRQPETGASPGL